MTFGDLVPWNRRERGVADQGGQSGGRELSPFLRLHQEMNRLFDDAFRGFDLAAPSGRNWPHMELKETDGEYRVLAELPGMDEKDVDVSFRDGVLTIRGEKRAEASDRDRTVSERWYGRFERSLALGDVDEGKASARFDKGVLTVTLPKSAKAQDRTRRIPINAADDTTRH
jgi:HSP20 family protein